MVIRIAREIAANLLMGVPSIAKRRIAAGRTSLPPTEANLRRFAFGIVDDNPAIAARVSGADVCEIGPGDHLATGLVLLGAGAKSYTVVDRFPGDYFGPDAQAWYAAVREARPTDADIRAVHAIPAAIENVAALPTDAFDLVISQAVGEHVTCIDAFTKATAKMLRPGGVAVHNVDFSNHGLLDGDEFLSVPETVWRWMGSNRGLPNRKRKADFLAAFAPYFNTTIAAQTPTWASFLLTKR
jgi:SAM-dependent methyltransferase